MIITVGNNKGGVGKTSVVCNLGVALARTGKRVLVIDADSQRNATSILLGDDLRLEYTLYELLDPESANGINVKMCIYPSRHSNLFCLPNVEETSALDIPLGQTIPESLLLLRKKVREFALSNFDITLIDNPPTIGLWLALSLNVSDFVIVPVDAGSGQSLEGLRRVLELITTIQKNTNPDLKFLRLLINRVDRRTSISKQVVSLIQARFPDRVFDTFIPMNTRVQQAEFLNLTIFERDQSCMAARAYRALAKELLTILSTLGKEESSGKATQAA